VGVKIPFTNIQIGLNLRSTLRNPDSWLYEALGAWKSKAGVAVTELSAGRLTAVAACWRIIGNPLASLPKYIYRLEADGDKIRELTHPAYKVINNPNRFINRNDFWRLMITRRLAYGNAYAYIKRNEYFEPIEFIPLRPGTCQAYFYNEELRYLCTDSDYPSIPSVLKPHEVFHLRNVNHCNNYEGFSPIREHAESLGVAIASEQYGAKFFGNSAIPAGYLKTVGDMNAIKADQTRKMWKDRNGGDNQSDIAVLGNGAEFIKLSIPPEEAQFLETRKYSVEEIARIYDVKPHMLADLSRATFSNIEHLGIEFVKNTLWNYGVEIEEECNSKLLTEEERGTFYTKFDYRELMMGDANAVADYIGKLISHGIYSINDGRLFIGENKVEGGDKRYINAAFMPIDLVSDFYQASINQKTPTTRAEILKLIEHAQSLHNQQEIIGFRKELDTILKQKEIQNEHNSNR
jgi:HK97 family phage portal protein